MDLTPITHIFSIIILILCSIPLTARYSRILYMKGLLHNSDEDKLASDYEKSKKQLYVHVLTYTILTVVIYFYW